MANPRKKSSAKGLVSELGTRADRSVAQHVERSADEYIRIRAYELYLERGDAPTDPTEDWLRAEQEYRERSSEKPRGEEVPQESSRQ